MLRIAFITLFITVSTATAGVAQGLTILSPSSFALLDAGSRERGAFEQGNAQPQRDSRLNGFLIGFAIGAVPGILLGMAIADYCENESTSCPIAIPYYAGLSGLAGGGIGFAVDGWIHDQASPSYRPRPGPSPGVRFKVTF